MLLPEHCKALFEACRQEPARLSTIRAAYEKAQEAGRDHCQGVEILPATRKVSEGAWVEAETENFPLHAALENFSTPPGLDVVEYLLQLNPQAVTMTNRKGMIPLHLACAAGANANPAVVKAVYEAWKNGLQIGTGQHRNLPIHIACLTKAPVSVIQVLVEPYPRSLLVRNSMKKTPYDMAMIPYTPAHETGACEIKPVKAVLTYLKENGAVGADLEDDNNENHSKQEEAMPTSSKHKHHKSNNKETTTTPSADASKQAESFVVKKVIHGANDDCEAFLQLRFR